MNPVIKLADMPMAEHPPYQDPNLRGQIGTIFKSDDGRFVAARWIAQGPGTLLERPDCDELICILAGHATVKLNGQTSTAGPGDVILWLKDHTPIITIENRLEAFCCAYTPT